jgi:hypothetical protein
MTLVPLIDAPGEVRVVAVIGSKATPMLYPRLAVLGIFRVIVTAIGTFTWAMKASGEKLAQFRKVSALVGCSRAGLPLVPSAPKVKSLTFIGIGSGPLFSTCKTVEVVVPGLALMTSETGDVVRLMPAVLAWAVMKVLNIVRLQRTAPSPAKTLGKRFITSKYIFLILNILVLDCFWWFIFRIPRLLFK